MIGLQSPPLYGIIWAKYSKKLLHSGFLDFYSLNFSEGKVPSDFRTDFNPLDWMFGRQSKVLCKYFLSPGANLPSGLGRISTFVDFVVIR